MAKANKKKAAKPAAKKAVKISLSKSSLVALSEGIANPAEVHVEFFSGLGQLTAVLFRRGVLINMESISTEGDIHFKDVQSGDTIAVNGVCAGTCTITISVPTNGPTPETFSKIITTGYTIL